MNEMLKKQNGVAAIAIVIIMVLSVAAGGTSFLGVRSVITGEPFLQPFEDMGLMEIEDDEEDEEAKASDKDEATDEDVVEDEKEDEDVEVDEKDDDTEEVFGEGEESSLLVTEINDDGVECYTIVVDLKEVADGMIPVLEELFAMYMEAGSDMMSGDTSSEEDAAMGDMLSEMLELIADMFTDCEIIIDCYANGNDVKQLLVTVPYEQLVKNVYNELSSIEELMKEVDPTADLGIEYGSYEEMLTELETVMKEELTTENLRTALTEELGTDYQDIVNSAECVIEDGRVQISMDLTSIDIDSYIEQYRTEIEELGIDPDNIVETAVDTWNEYIDEIGYDGLIEGAFSMVMDTYNMLSY